MIVHHKEAAIFCGNGMCCCYCHLFVYRERLL